MALITEQERPAIEETRIEELFETISSLASTLKLAENLLEQETYDVAKETQKYLNDVRAAFKQAVDLEKLLNAERKQRSSAAAGYALDLGAARSQIGCRLAKLRVRKCCKGVS
ncbi:hypothetical protein [Poseidonocella sedimentorum]|uniref:Uncharacterized protein n=1 Tax=Poseidonocella sedimentorum TaxID=871652 RepID=A0A1I6DH76_9RHOB|nr:hypothetical protein [Poseidonocella sedimentorum]SFR04793.1 hypothetical protein SAMN04515673_103244 [Poseidonocella sedimentorum]